MQCECAICTFLCRKKVQGCRQNDDSTKEYGSVWKRLYATVPSLPEPPSFVCINRIIPQALGGSGLPPFHTAGSPCYMLCWLLKTSEKPPLRKTKEEMKEGALPVWLRSTLLSLHLLFFRPHSHSLSRDVEKTVYDSSLKTSGLGGEFSSSPMSIFFLCCWACFFPIMWMTFF